jgi:hypothetical protein
MGSKLYNLASLFSSSIHVIRISRHGLVALHLHPGRIVARRRVRVFVHRHGVGQRQRVRLLSLVAHTLVPRGRLRGERDVLVEEAHAQRTAMRVSRARGGSARRDTHVFAFLSTISDTDAGERQIGSSSSCASAAPPHTSAGKRTT